MRNRQVSGRATITNVLFITSTKTKETPSISPHWAQSDSTSHWLPSTVTRTLLRHFLSYMCSANRFLQQYVVGAWELPPWACTSPAPLCSPTLRHFGLQWNYGVSSPRQVSCSALPGFQSLLVGTANTQWTGRLRLCSPALLSSWAPVRQRALAQGGTTGTSHCNEILINLPSRVTSFLRYNTWGQHRVLIKISLQIACWFSSTF